MLTYRVFEPGMLRGGFRRHKGVERQDIADALDQ
jgi:hypothetical protein